MTRKQPRPSNCGIWARDQETCWQKLARAIAPSVSKCQNICLQENAKEARPAEDEYPFLAIIYFVSRFQYANRRGGVTNNQLSIRAHKQATRIDYTARKTRPKSRARNPNMIYLDSRGMPYDSPPIGKRPIRSSTRMDEHERARAINPNR